MRDGTQITVVAIGVAAELCEVHPQTLREYERQGLITPLRTTGGARRYREEDIRQVRKIVALSEQGMSLGAIDYILTMEDRMQKMARRIAELEDELASRPPSKQSMSMEIVHIPRRQQRRWSNDWWVEQ